MNLLDIESVAKLVSLLKVKYMEINLLTTLLEGESVNLLPILLASKCVNISIALSVENTIEYRICS